MILKNQNHDRTNQTWIVWSNEQKNCSFEQSLHIDSSKMTNVWSTKNYFWFWKKAMWKKNKKKKKSIKFTSKYYCNRLTTNITKKKEKKLFDMFRNIVESIVIWLIFFSRLFSLNYLTNRMKKLIKRWTIYIQF